MLLFSFLSEPLLHPPSRRRPCSVGCRPSLRLAFARTCPTHAYSHTHHCYPRTFDMHSIFVSERTNKRNHHHHKTPSLDHARAQEHWKTYGPSLSSVGSKNPLGTWIHRRHTHTHTHTHSHTHARTHTHTHIHQPHRRLPQRELVLLCPFETTIISPPVHVTSWNASHHHKRYVIMYICACTSIYK